MSKDIFNHLTGSTSYELYVYYAKFAQCVLKYAKEDKNIQTELLSGENLVTKKIIASLRIAWVIESFGVSTLKSITSVPISYWEKLSFDKWVEVENLLKDGLKFSNKWADTAKKMVGNLKVLKI